MEDFWRSTKIIHPKGVCCGEYRSLILAILMLLLFSAHRKPIHVRKETNFQKYRMQLFRKMKFLRKSLGLDTSILPLGTYLLTASPRNLLRFYCIADICATSIVNPKIAFRYLYRERFSRWYLQNVPLETMLTSR